MTDNVYWVWASGALGPGAFTDNFFGAFADAKALYDASDSQRRLSGALTPAQLSRLANSSLDDAKRAVELCEKNSWCCLGYDDPDFPDSLRRLSDAPLVLYVWGDIKDIDKQFCFGIVGTRNPTADSVKVASSISYSLTEAGAVIVSGGALGIDSAAHEGALEAGGRTICVLGCGLGTRYLMTNDSLRRRVSKSGAVISEFAPFSTASRVSFPIRNRIISGLSRGVLVVEAGEKSGSIITANCAFEQGKDVFAVPGSVTTSAYAGANRLIRDGARAVACADDIIRDYADLMPGALKAKPAPGQAQSEPAAPKKKPPVGLSDEEKQIYALINEEPVYPGELAALSGLGIARVMSVLTVLEIKDFIVSLPGGRYAVQ